MVAALLQLAATHLPFDRLRDSAYRIRRYALDMGEVQGQGYIGQALGVADVLAVAEVAGVMGAKRTGELMPVMCQLGPAVPVAGM